MRWKLLLLGLGGGELFKVVAEQLEGFVLDLADALSRVRPMRSPISLSVMGLFAVEAVAELEDLGLALVDLVEQELAELASSSLSQTCSSGPGLCVSATSSLMVSSPSAPSRTAWGSGRP